MAIVTEVRFAHGDGALADTLAALPDVDVTVIREASTDPGGSVYLLRFDGDIGGYEELEEVLDADHTVRAAEPMSGFEDQHLWGVEFSAEAKLLAPKVTNEEGFVLDARSSDLDGGRRGWHERWLVPDREALHEIWEGAREEGFEFEIIEFRSQGRTDPEYPGGGAPTDEQREALLAAYEHGYFAEPRETSLEELAEVLGLSPTAVGGRLRRGMRSLVGMTLVVERPEE
ncbi:helix-turn-helix domain-containing protein [Salinirubellus sp. GCM10025818]|uniref:helix-turn-helix domain-containing protein n=1 Tax=Salinirubellus TaxID=2162630 RepID=UPI0030CD2930